MTEMKPLYVPLLAKGGACRLFDPWSVGIDIQAHLETQPIVSPSFDRGC